MCFWELRDLEGNPMQSKKSEATNRSYTLDEIDRMREAIRWLYPKGISYEPAERNADIENRIRTYMAAGIFPEELEKKMNELIHKRQQNV
jgi:hypothetical protein